MAGVFPDREWLDGFIAYLNSNEKYAQVARNWEGDMIFDLKAEGALETDTKIYLDLWHGTCRGGKIVTGEEQVDAAFTLTAPYTNFVKVIKGETDPMQALMTRKLLVKGNMTYMMRNVPTVLEFVRCAKKATEAVLGD